MKNIEMISAASVTKLDELGMALSETYKITFSNYPWYKVSINDPLNSTAVWNEKIRQLCNWDGISRTRKLLIYQYGN